MTRRGDRDASERKNRIGEDERQPVMARLVAQIGDVGNAEERKPSWRSING